MADAIDATHLRRDNLADHLLSPIKNRPAPAAGLPRRPETERHLPRPLHRLGRHPLTNRPMPSLPLLTAAVTLRPFFAAAAMDDSAQSEIFSPTDRLASVSIESHRGAAKLCALLTSRRSPARFARTSTVFASLRAPPGVHFHEDHEQQLLSIFKAYAAIDPGRPTGARRIVELTLNTGPIAAHLRITSGIFEQGCDDTNPVSP